MHEQLENIFRKMRQDVEQMAPIGATMKLKVDGYLFVIDGKGERNIISENDTPTDCTVRTSGDTFLLIKSGKLDPVDALMDEKMSIDGSFGTAFNLRYLITGGTPTT